MTSFVVSFLIVNNYKLIKCCKNSAENSHDPFLQPLPMVTPYTTRVHYQNQEIGISTVLLTRISPFFLHALDVCVVL